MSQLIVAIHQHSVRAAVLAVLSVCCLQNVTCAVDEVNEPTPAGELQALIEAREKLPPMQIHVTAIMRQHPNSKLVGRVVESDLLSDGQRFRTFWDERRPNDPDLPHHSVGCSFDGSRFRNDPWGKRDDPTSRFAFVAVELGFQSVTEISKANRLNGCGFYDYKYMGLQLNDFTDGHLFFFSETGRTLSSVHEMLTLATAPESWIATIHPLATPDCFTIRIHGREPDQGTYEVWELDYWRAPRRVQRIERRYVANLADLTPGDYGGGGEVLTLQWNADPTKLLPDSATYSRFEPELKYHEEWKISATEVRDSDLSSEAFGWKSLNLPKGRTARLNDSSPEFSIWNGEEFVPMTAEPEPVPLVNRRRTESSGMISWVILFVNVLLGVALLVVWLKKRKPGMNHPEA